MTALYSANKPSFAEPMTEFGPLGGVPAAERAKTTPSRSNRQPKSRTPQPDAFRSLSPPRLLHQTDLEEQRQVGLTVPDEFGAMGSPQSAAISPSMSVNSWEDEIIPTVARKLEQQRLLAGDPRLSRIEGLVDTWDRDGLPLSISEMAIRGKQTRGLAERRTQSSSRLRAQAAEDAPDSGPGDQNGLKGPRKRVQSHSPQALMPSRSANGAERPPQGSRLKPQAHEEAEERRSAKGSNKSGQEQLLNALGLSDTDNAVRTPSLETRRNKASQSQQQDQAAYTAPYPPQPQPPVQVFQPAQPQHQVSLKPPAQKEKDEGAGCCKCSIM